MQVCWLRSLTRITYLCKLIGIRLLAAVLQFELFRVTKRKHYEKDNVFTHRTGVVQRDGSFC
ncbi:hypothetical protein BME18_11585 [Klebsiella michiganensis]|nr:hypothetical protein BME18_11585 [Klebsiella michiganensis]